MGYESKEIAASSSSLTIKLSESSKQLEEVVVVGYGTMKKRDVTGAITSISSEEIEKKMEVCRNKRCTFFFSSITKEKFDIFKQQYFEDFFDLCVPCI